MSSIDKLIIGVILLLLGIAFGEKAKADVEHWGGLNIGSRHFTSGGLNIGSRHFTSDNDRYCEDNPGVFYERRWRNGTTGLQVGYYRNSFCKRQNENRSDDTFYAVGVYQPWRWEDVRFGVFGGPASGYKRGNLVLIAGGMVTWEVTREVAVQAIVNPAVAGLQVKLRF